jgi:hypothetical protein
MAKNSKKGVKYGLRTNNSEVVQPNQWTGTPQQEKFLLLYLDPKSPTFANPYESAMEAGFSESYARIIAAPSVNRLWVQQARNLVSLGPEHIAQKLTELALDNGNKAGDQIRALELIAKMQGLLVDRKVVAHGTFEEALNELK